MIHELIPHLTIQENSLISGRCVNLSVNVLIMRHFSDARVHKVHEEVVTRFSVQHSKKVFFPNYSFWPLVSFLLLFLTIDIVLPVVSGLFLTHSKYTIKGSLLINCKFLDVFIHWKFEHANFFSHLYLVIMYGEKMGVGVTEKNAFFLSLCGCFISFLTFFIFLFFILYFFALGDDWRKRLCATRLEGINSEVRN